MDGPDNGIGIRPMRDHSETSAIGLVNLKSWQEMVMASFRYTFLIVSFVPKTLDGVMRTKVMTIYDKLLLYIQCMSWSKYDVYHNEYKCMGQTMEGKVHLLKVPPSCIS